MKKTVRDINVSGKRVLVRVDFNVPLENGMVNDDSRIQAALPTIQYLIEQQARVILITHLDRPDGFVIDPLRLDGIADFLSSLIDSPVYKVNNCIGPEVQEAVKSLEPGSVLILENVRFHPGEVVNDPHFAARLSSVADVFVNDAFATSHRAHASTVGVTRYLPAVSGLLMERELNELSRTRTMLSNPLVLLLGGTDLVDKTHFIDYFLERTSYTRSTGENRMILGGILANTFLRAAGYETGQSTVEAEALGLAKELLVDAGSSLILPTDVVVTDAHSSAIETRVVSVKRILPKNRIVDIGPRTMEQYAQTITSARTIIWNGIMASVNIPAFRKNSLSLAKRIGSLRGAVTIAGGGNTISILEEAGVLDKMSYTSTGGAAFLDALQGRGLPGVDALDDKHVERTDTQEGNPSAVRMQEESGT